MDLNAATATGDQEENMACAFMEEIEEATPSQATSQKLLFKAFEKVNTADRLHEHKETPTLN
eukprot:15159926-Heterocapsa_arctica.AAC.1